MMALFRRIAVRRCIDRDLAALRAKYAGDPRGFRHAAGEYIDDLRQHGMPDHNQIRLNAIKALELGVDFIG